MVLWFKNKLFCSKCWCLLFFLLTLGPYVSCTISPHKHTTYAGAEEYKDTIPRKPPSNFSDTVTIDVPAAVFYNPDSLQKEKLKTIIDTIIYKSIMHDYFYQMENSRLVLKRYYPYIKIVEVKNARYLLFRKTGNQEECIDLNTKEEPCGIFIFDGKKAPHQVDMMNIDTELGVYFSSDTNKK